MAQVTHDQFLGALLGMAIGDAMGMPVTGWPAERIRARFGRIEEFHRLVFPDGAEIRAGEFAGDAELALCVVESLTASDGVLDPENLAARMRMVARGESRRWIHADTLAGLAAAGANDWSQVPLRDDAPASGDVASRGIPLGLLYSTGKRDPVGLRRDAEIATRVTHGSPLAIAAVTAVALAIETVARDPASLPHLPGTVADLLGGGQVAESLQQAQVLRDRDVETDEIMQRLGLEAGAAEVVATAMALASAGGEPVQTIQIAVNAGGATASRAAIAGAVTGAAFGVAAIPQPVIDRLESRIYLSLAAPLFYRVAQKRGGTLIELRPRG